MTAPKLCTLHAGEKNGDQAVVIFLIIARMEKYENPSFS